MMMIIFMGMMMMVVVMLVMMMMIMMVIHFSHIAILYSSSSSRCIVYLLSDRRFSCHILSGVQYLHSKGIIHRDIKGANILVDASCGVAKLADFGCSKQLLGIFTGSIEESMKAIRGSVPWMAPEVIKQSGHGRPADIWSVGATMIEMATGKPPWPEFSNNNLATLFHVANSTTPPPIPENLSPDCRHCISMCMMIDPTERLTAQQLVDDCEFISYELKSNGNKAANAAAASLIASEQLQKADVSEQIW